jgi:hypothetical protein
VCCLISGQSEKRRLSMFRDMKEAWIEWCEKGKQFKIASAMIALFVVLMIAICVTQSPVPMAW